MSYQPLVIHCRPRKKPQPLRLSIIISLLFALSMIMQVSPVYPAHSSHARARAAYSVSGTVFDDYNQNGTQESREPGLNGVVVTAYNSANAAVATMATATNNITLGRYAISISDGTGPVRIQFSNFGATSTLAQLKGYQPSNHAGGTTIAFVDGTQATYTVNLGLEYPSDYCQNNPNVVAFCQAAPIEIGNRVWNDLNGNGIQDPDEAPIAGVTVNLYAVDGTTLIATTTTNTNGEYYFTINPYTSYVMKLDNAADYTGSGPLNGFQLTVANQDSSTHVADSKAVLPMPTSSLGTGNYPQIVVAAHTPGQNDYVEDIGFTLLPDLSLTKSNMGGNSFYEGQSIIYTLTTHSSASAGPVISKEPIIVTDTLPAGLSDVSISAPGWQISVSSPAINHVNSSSRKNHAHIQIRHTLPARRIVPISHLHARSTLRAEQRRAPFQVTRVKRKHGLRVGLFKLGSIASPLSIKATYTGAYPVAQGTDLPSITITGTFNASAVSSLVNNASVSTPGDTNASNNAATDTVAVALAPDLGIQVSHQGSGCVPLGQSVSYAIAVSNGSSAGVVPTGQTITVSDTLPSGLSKVSIDGGSDWNITPNGTTFTATYKGSLPVASHTQLTPITITGVVSSSAASTQMTNSATVHTGLDINAANDAGSDSMTICAAPDLAIVKTQTGSNPFHIGQQVTFSLAVSNGASAGPIIAGQPIMVSDTLPAGQSITVTDILSVGLTGVDAPSTSDWAITSATSAVATTITATYQGSYPVSAGATLGDITISGTLTREAVPNLVNSAAVATPQDSQAGNDTVINTIAVRSLSDPGAPGQRLLQTGRYRDLHHYSDTPLGLKSKSPACHKRPILQISCGST